VEISEWHGLAKGRHKGRGREEEEEEEEEEDWGKRKNVEKEQVGLFIVLGQRVKGNEVGMMGLFQARFEVGGGGGVEIV